MIRKPLSVKQLKYLAKVKESSGLLFYQLVNKLSVELHVPKSTVRWNLGRLRDSGMIIAGNKDAKGVPIKLTEKGEIALQIMKGEYEFLGKNYCPKALFKAMHYFHIHGNDDEAKKIH
jgi:DNA-binding transcriptional ArsR family regulator